MASVPEDIRETLEQHGVLDAPKLPDLKKLVGYARTKAASVSIFWPSESEDTTSVTVRCQGHTFTKEHRDAEIAMAYALAETLEVTQPKQLSLE